MTPEDLEIYTKRLLLRLADDVNQKICPICREPFEELDAISTTVHILPCCDNIRLEVFDRMRELGYLA